MNRLLLLLTTFCICAALPAQNQVLIPYRLKSKWGFCDTLANIVIQPQYDTVGLFQNGKGKSKLAYAELGGKKGLLDPQGKVVVPLTYDKIDIENLYWNGFVTVRQGKNYGVFAETGKEILPAAFSEVRFAGDKDGFIVKKGKKFGVYSITGAERLAVKYDSIRYDMMYNPQSGQSLNGLFAISKGKWFFLGPGGQLEPLNPEEWRYEDVAIFDVEEGGSDNCQMPLPKQLAGYDAVKRIPGCSCDIYMGKKGGKYGLTNNRGKEISPAVYDTLICNSYDILSKKGNYIAFREKKMGVIDDANKELLPFEYDGFTGTGNYIYIRKNGLSGCFIPGTIYPPIQAQYQYIRIATNIPIHPRWSFGVFKVQKDGKWGYVGENGVEYFSN